MQRYLHGCGWKNFSSWRKLEGWGDTMHRGADLCYLYSSCEIKDLSSLEVLASAWHPTYVIVKYDDKRKEGWMAAQKMLREMETKFIRTEIHLFILSRSKRYEEWKKICFCWKREIQIMVFGHNTKLEADMNSLRKQNSGLSLKGKNKQFTFHSVSVQAKLRNTILWQGQCIMNKTKQKYLWDCGWFCTEFGTDLISARREPQAV